MSNLVKEAQERITNGEGTDEDMALVAANDDSIEQDKQEVQEKTQSKLDEIFNSEGDQAELNDEEKDSTSEDDTTEKGDTQTESETDLDDSTLDDTEEKKDSKVADNKKKEAGDKPTLADSYIRAAIHQGWKEEEVQDFFEKNPEQAIKTLKNIYESTNRLSKQFSTLGRAQQKQQNHGQEQKSSDFKALDIKKLKEEYPDDPIVDSIVAPLNDTLNQMKQQIDSLSQQNRAESITVAEQKAINSENRMIENQIFTFFDERDDMKPYKNFYGTLEKGKTWDELPQLQHQNRWSVLQQADLLLNGAAIQGEEMDVGEALNLAHMLATDGMKEQIIREKIKKQVKKRSNGLTLKPSKEKIKAKDTISSKQKLVKMVGKKIKEYFPNN